MQDVNTEAAGVSHVSETSGRSYPRQLIHQTGPALEQIAPERIYQTFDMAEKDYMFICLPTFISDLLSTPCVGIGSHIIPV